MITCTTQHMIISFQIWTLVAEEGFQYVKLTFLRFELEDHSFCAYDYVEISYDGYSQKICGTRTFEEFTSTSNTMTVKIKTDNIVTKSGFRARWISTNTSPFQISNQLENDESGSGKCDVGHRFLKMLLVI